MQTVKLKNKKKGFYDIDIYIIKKKTSLNIKKERQYQPSSNIGYESYKLFFIKCTNKQKNSPIFQSVRGGDGG